MFKVLVIAYYFPPMGLSGVQRTLKFVKYMKKYNWEPTVITAGKVAYFAHDTSLLKESEEAGIRIIRTEANDPNSVLSRLGTVRLPSEFLRKFLNRMSQTIFVPDNKVSWSKKAYKKASELLSKEHFDVIFVTVPPFSSFVMAAQLKRKFKVPLFVDYRDLWYDSYLSFYPTPLHKYLNKKMEYNALKAADKIIVTNRKIKELLIRVYNFLTFEDLVIIPHGYDAADFTSFATGNASNKKMILTYSGIFYEHNTPKHFFSAFNKLKKENPHIAGNIELHFVGHLGKSNIKLIKNYNLQEFVVNHGYLNHDEAIEKIMFSDVLWMMLGKWKHSDTILPGKLMEYIGSGKPFIACLPDGAAKMIAAGCGAAFITAPDNDEEIKNTILKVYDLFTRNALPIPNEEFIKQYQREYLTELLTKEFQFLVKDEVV
ncbi:MAG TPA: glycosyltransferase family 4 protein [Ignavibacteriaceae bacterium]|nr:glycosyltransferase family 4 protein [Ignavibacteriaceae bacterium]